MSIVKKEFSYAGRNYTLETGKIARQATSAVWLQSGKSVIMVTVVVSPNASSAGFFPLTVHYVEKAYSAGQIPGGFTRREGKLSDREVLISRLIDRSLRPTFPDDFCNEVQIIATVLSLDPEHETDILAMIASFAAVAISGLPVKSTLGVARVGLSNNGDFILCPSKAQMKKSLLDMVVAGNSDAILMVESEAKQLPEDKMLDALVFAQENMQDLIRAIDEFKSDIAKPVMEWTKVTLNSTLLEKIESSYENDISSVYKEHDKISRYKSISILKDKIIRDILSSSESEEPKGQEEIEKNIEQIFHIISAKVVRKSILNGEVRIDGRDSSSVRPISVEVGILPSVHGSALFTRGETQALVTATLSSPRSAQLLDSIHGESSEWFMFQYNFLPFCVGEIGMLGMPKRREIGHGNLAKRGILGSMPSQEDFPYSLRVVSEITESNGSSSMASVCGSSLALMDAGIKVNAPIAGIAMGLIKEGDNYVVLTDIMGDEDHLGDMDFKVAGSRDGITALQMDIKIDGINKDILDKSLQEAKKGRIHILDKMASALSEPRPEVSSIAPSIITEKIDPKKIRDVIGKGGSTIQEISRNSGAEVNISDDGTIKIYADQKIKADKALSDILAITSDIERGQIFEGKVSKITDFGAFVALNGTNKEGLLHISQISEGFLESVSSVLSEGQRVKVKVLGTDNKGKIKLIYKGVEQIF